MLKCFLSHSSLDKKGYVEIVAKHLGLQNCVYDDYTFEDGMKSIEEIEKHLNGSQLFVIFLSDNALNSDWVKLELDKASILLNEGKMKRIYPIIIDDKITHLDKRIPKWLNENYNLKYISRPTVAARRIKQRLIELSWEVHPRLQEKSKIFVGRNELINKLEERLDKLDQPKPTVIFASGLNKIGRTTFLRHCFIKSNIFSHSYDPPIISLNSHESIEDFILKVYDLGFSTTLDLKDLMKKNIIEKIELSVKLIEDLQKAKEILFIRDFGCIVTNDREVSNWFGNIIDSVKKSNLLTIAVASNRRLLHNKIIYKEHIFYIEIPELEIQERNGLLKRYSEFEKLDLITEDLQFIANLLTGFPEQVFYSVHLVKEMGLPSVKNNSYLIIDYSSQKIIQLLSKYDEDERAYDFLFFLSEYDFITYEFIFEIVGEDEYYKKIFNDLIASAIIEFLGANKEYVRINDAVRDYVKRNRLSMPDEYKKKIKLHLEKFLGTYQTEEKDAADILNSLKNALINEEEVDIKYLIPSHFVKTMKELYDVHKKYREVISLADRVLLNEKYMDKNIIHEIRYFLCISLARIRDSRFLSEVRKIQNNEAYFLKGFYYRMVGRYNYAIENQLSFLETKRDSPRAKRELVQIYLHLEDYEKAYALASENYYNDKNNPYHMQAYFSCLIRGAKTKDSVRIIEEILHNFKSTKSEVAREMFDCCQSEYLAFIKNNEEDSLLTINGAIKLNPKSIYPQLTKISICGRFNRLNDMKAMLDQLEPSLETNSHIFKTFIKYKARYYTKISKVDIAIELIDKNFSNYTSEMIELLKEKITRSEDFA